MRTAMLAVLTLLMAASAYGQPVPPAPGVVMPDGYFARIAEDPSAFQFQHAWINKARETKQARMQLLDEVGRGERPALNFASMSMAERNRISVMGTVAVPVILMEYSNQAAASTRTQMDNQLFTNNPTGTITEMYSEMSYGAVNMTGDVFDWVTTVQTDVYYEGGCNGIFCGNAKTGELILEALNGVDGTVDFGAYDNDGPDGLPNSGDDDGFVDFVAIVHSEGGGECGGPNMWSHRWVVTGWSNEFPSPYTTNDARAGGGFIRVLDYTIQPSRGSTNGCGTGIIEIGVYAHEFGHAFGLPDLYDTDQGGQGIGEHGLMGSGNWNDPPNPAHMNAWSKMELGWLMSTNVGPTSTQYSIPDVETTPMAYQLNVGEEKFARKTDAAFSGSYALHCGINQAEAGNRNWAQGRGYGNNWDEQLVREFGFDGSTPVTLQFSAGYDMETNYDFGRVKIRVNNVETTVRSYTGTGSDVNRSISLTPYLNGSGASSYEIILQFESDFAVSDEDGGAPFTTFNSVNPFVVDDISVAGGGESYSTDFETNESGWHYDYQATPHREYFLVENRSSVNGQFDQNLHGEGLYIWHIEDNLQGDNTSGSTTTSNLRPANVTLVTADGFNQLLLNGNRGDGGDVYPGLTNNLTFNSVSNPNSNSHNGNTTNVAVTNIGSPSANMLAMMRAGFPAPTISGIAPANGDVDQLVLTDVTGTDFDFGSTVLLRSPGTKAAVDINATNVEWVGRTLVEATFDLTGAAPGDYDVIVQRPDGGEATLASGFTVSSPSPVFIQAFDAVVSEGGVDLSWDVFADEPITGYNVMRRETGTTVSTRINDDVLAPATRGYRDASIEAGKGYDYTLVVVFPDGSELRSQTMSARTAALRLALAQNFPNPFNPTTTIRFTMPEAGAVALSIFDGKGRRVRTLVNEDRPAGGNSAVWNARNDAGQPVASGVYFYRLTYGKDVLTRKLLLLK